MAPVQELTTHKPRITRETLEQAAQSELATIFDVRTDQLAGYLFINERLRNGVNSVADTKGVLFKPTGNEEFMLDGTTQTLRDVVSTLGITATEIYMIKYIGKDRIVQPHTLVLVEQTDQGNILRIIELWDNTTKSVQNTLFRFSKRNSVEKNDMLITVNEIQLSGKCFDSATTATIGCDNECNTRISHSVSGRLTPNLSTNTDSRLKMYAFVVGNFHGVID